MIQRDVRAIFCDVGNVLLWFDLRTERLLKLAAIFNPTRFSQEATGVATAQQEFFTTLQQLGVMEAGPVNGDWAGVENRFPGFDTGQITHHQFYLAFLEAAQVTEQIAPSEAFWGLYFANHYSIPEVCGLMERVRQSGVVVVAATNGDFYSPQQVMLQTRLRFDGVVNSWQIGVQKPDERFFAACRASAESALTSQLRWDECLFIDDHTPYIEAFRRLGGRAIRFRASRDRETLSWEVNNLQALLTGSGIVLP